MSKTLLPIRLVVLHLLLISISFSSVAQMISGSQIIDNFDDNIVTNWTVPAAGCANTHTISESNAELRVDFSINQPECYDYFYKTLPAQTDFTTTPVLCLKLRSQVATFIKLQVELQDNVGRKTNALPFIISNPTIVAIDGNNPNGQYFEYCFDFSTNWGQVFPSVDVVDKTRITRINFYINGNGAPAGYYTGGTLYMDDIIRRPNNPTPSGGGTFYSNGSAANMSSSTTNHIYRLTDDNGLFQSSTVFNKTAHNWSTNFDGYFNVFVGCNDASGADGISFMLMNDAAKLTKTGGGGGGFGYGQGQRSYREFPKSLAIEFDTWDNTGDGMTNDVAGATSNDHMAIDQNGHENSTLAGTVVNMGNLEDDQIHLLRVNYTAATNTLRIYWDGVLRLTHTINIANYFNTGAAPTSTTAYWGFSGSTGGAKNEQWFSYNGTSSPPTYTTMCNWALPVELISFTGHRIADEVKLIWSTSSEKDHDYFEIEKSYNGSDWTTLDQIYGKGDENSLSEYGYADPEPGKAYYRLKQVDVSGKISFSPIVVIQSDLEEISIYPNPASEKVTVTVPEGKEAVVIIADLAGKEVYHFLEVIDENRKIQIRVNDFQEGFYVVRVIGESEEYHSTILVK